MPAAAAAQHDIENMCVSVAVGCASSALRCRAVVVVAVVTVVLVVVVVVVTHEYMHV